MEIIVLNRRWVFKLSVWIGVLAAVGLLIGLAVWQWHRAAEKAQLLERLAQRATAEQIAIDILQAFPMSEADGLPVKGRARWLQPQLWLLDNQMIDGRIGYDVIIPVRLAHDTQPMLVNLGWVPAPTNRDALPVVIPPAEFEVQGLLRTHLGGFSLGQNLEKTGHWPMRIQRVKIDELNPLMREPLYTGVIYQTQGSPYKIHYQPVVILPERHRAYAVQWAVLAVAVLLVALAASATRVPAGQSAPVKPQAKFKVRKLPSRVSP